MSGLIGYPYRAVVSLDSDNWLWLKDHARINRTSAAAIMRGLIETYREAAELEASAKLDRMSWQAALLKSVRF